MHLNAKINKDQNTTLIINNSNMRIGGIETKFADIIRYFLDNGNRVIWITHEKEKDKFAYEDIKLKKRFEVVVFSRFNRLYSMPNISFSTNEKIVMLTCKAIDYLVFERLKDIHKDNTFKHFLVLPHFTGKEYYVDQWFLFGRKFVYKWYIGFLKKIVSSQSLLAFNIKHLEEYEKYYRINIENKEEQVLPTFRNKNIFDIKSVIDKASNRSRSFAITTCARFEFPHKGYIIGLINSFYNLKCKYPNIKLNIVGYGPGENVVKDCINSLPSNVKKDIHLYGMVTPEELKDIYCKAHLAVGLAGAISVAAQCGVPSIIVRHYSYDCDAYGYYCEVPNMLLSTVPGLKIEPFIEKVVLMGNSDYINLSKDCYNVSYKDYCFNPEFFEKKMSNHGIKIVKNNWQKIFIQILFLVIRFKSNILKQC